MHYLFFMKMDIPNWIKVWCRGVCCIPISNTAQEINKKNQLSLGYFYLFIFFSAIQSDYTGLHPYTFTTTLFF